MFGSKRNTLPPRPEPPNTEKILEDLQISANKNDVAFKPFSKDSSAFSENATTAELNELNLVYEKVKTYLDVNKRLKVLKESIKEHEVQLQSNIENMVDITEDLKQQAQAALT